MSYPRTIRNFSAFLDGIGYFGKITEATLPKLEMNKIDHRGGGMDGSVPIDMGMNAMASEQTFSEWSPELLQTFGTRQRLILRPGAMGQDDFSADTFIATIGGLFTTLDGGSLKPGEEAPLKLSLAVDYFKLERNGEQMFEIDVENGKRIIGGVDQLVEMRKAMGL